MNAAGGQLLDRLLGQPLAVVLPLLDEIPHGGEAELAAEVLEPLLAHAGGRDHGQVVAVPDLGTRMRFRHMRMMSPTSV